MVVRRSGPGQLVDLDLDPELEPDPEPAAAAGKEKRTSTGREEEVRRHFTSTDFSRNASTAGSLFVLGDAGEDSEDAELLAALGRLYM